MDRKMTWRDRLISGAVFLMGLGVVWLMIGICTDRDRDNSSSFVCLPLCHHCDEVSGTQHGPGLKPPATRCDQNCQSCNQARVAARRLDSVLLRAGAMEPG